MCRFLVYKGKDEILLSKLILDPTHSILTQSYDSRLRLDYRRPHNGDGFGVGYYTDPALGPEPCIFTSTIPAWNCINLERLAAKTASNLIFAHVRATTEGNLSDSNCHPFRHGSLMWMHNGGIGAWKHVKRRLAMSVKDEWFMGVQGSTDSEWAFALFLDSMDRMGHSPNTELGENGFGHSVLRKAMLKTIERINKLIAEIPEDQRPEDTRSLLNFAVTDGACVVCTRYVSSKTDEPASLFFSSGTSWSPVPKSTDQEAQVKNDDANRAQIHPRSQPATYGQTSYRMSRLDRGADIVLVASEPLTFERDNWVTVPTNSILTISGQTVMIHPIRDEFWSENPAVERSMEFAETKGQAVGAKGATGIEKGTKVPDRARLEVGCGA
ncbi:N-terminal nucleophile aminohydrolase [Pseudovirgaria hyperparasitica]|uniref:N-terminal nucleophile aminohydrolase n=1 Tax=Pseudovirgaria hyperparasitica TaxID=470096 RepID=A0A6A6WL00_9PEZI|nr:N-terminal nucleophile aminohydrolase [Pseudovirgaria hyperparasitica]KAF2762842.1 N-terminal nucleophile aminohydrolase [Pseudovirgaria hyperparasitica]